MLFERLYQFVDNGIDAFYYDGEIDGVTGLCFRLTQTGQNLGVRVYYDESESEVITYNGSTTSRVDPERLIGLLTADVVSWLNYIYAGDGTFVASAPASVTQLPTVFFRVGVGEVANVVYNMQTIQATDGEDSVDLRVLVGSDGSCVILRNGLACFSDGQSLDLSEDTSRCISDSFANIELNFLSIDIDEYTVMDTPISELPHHDMFVSLDNCIVGTTGTIDVTYRLDDENGVVLGSGVLDRDNNLATYTWLHNIEL